MDLDYLRCSRSADKGGDDQPDDGQIVVSTRLRSNTAYVMLGREGKENAGMPTC